MTTAVIAGYVRSPFTLANKGALVGTRPDDLAAQVIAGLLKQTKVDPAKIEDVIMGCAFPEGEQGMNIARIAGLMAGLPITVAGTTVNRFCGSSMQSIHMAAGAIASGAGDAFICAGIESMSRVPMGGYNPMVHPDFSKVSEVYISMGDTAENLSKKFGISRKEQEEYAVASHAKAAKAQDTGKFKDEIVPIKTIKGETVDKDGCIRPTTTLEGLADLKPAFQENGVVTAGTSSPLTDGASAVLVCSEEFAKKNKLKVMAKIKSYAVAGCAPEIMGYGPVAAVKKALERANLKLSDIDIIESNEAFAVQSLTVAKELGFNDNKVNLDGGALAMGHPLGATGARITGKAAALLVREGKKYALSTQCIGGGQGIATILEAVK